MNKDIKELQRLAYEVSARLYGLEIPTELYHMVGQLCSKASELCKHEQEPVHRRRDFMNHVVENIEDNHAPDPEKARTRRESSRSDDMELKCREASLLLGKDMSLADIARQIGVPYANLRTQMIKRNLYSAKVRS